VHWIRCTLFQRSVDQPRLYATTILLRNSNRYCYIRISGKFTYNVFNQGYSIARRAATRRDAFCWAFRVGFNCSHSVHLSRDIDLCRYDERAWANIAYEVYAAIMGLRNASVTVQKRPTSGLHVLLDVSIHCGRFHGQWARRCGALLACVRVRLAAARATANPGFTPLIRNTLS
jgi:hypothetical protein